MGLNEEQKQKALELRDKLANQFDPNKAKEFIEDMKSKSWYDDFKLLYEMVTDKTYTISGYTKVIIMGALAYVIMPVDIIPDFIPVIGWIDDVFVLSMTINSIKDEIENYKRHKNEKNK
jgi:uncharacterized membrane protein YkvA (DUF1232 family)